MKSGISQRPIDPSDALADVMEPSVGGVVLFVGTIRNLTNGKQVTSLEYEVYRKMAERRIAELEKEIRRRWPVKSIRLAHREGKLKIGDVSVVVAISAEHRGEAFDAARYAINTIKKSFPIWKRERFRKGRCEWVKGTPIQDWRRSRSASKASKGTSLQRIVRRRRRNLSGTRPKPSRLLVTR